MVHATDVAAARAPLGSDHAATVAQGVAQHRGPSATEDGRPPVAARPGGHRLAGLPGAYSPPAGCLLLAELGGLPAGCVALRPLDGARCEMKRLYVRAAFRGAGLAGILVEHVIERARTQGYREMYLDTMPKMRAARVMYDMLGFKACAPYLAEPTPGADCLVLDLAVER